MTSQVGNLSIFSDHFKAAGLFYHISLGIIFPSCSPHTYLIAFHGQLGSSDASNS